MLPSDVPHALRIVNEYDEDDALEARDTYEESIEGQYCLCERGQVIGVVGAKPIEDTDGSMGLSWTYLQRAVRRSGKGSQMLQWIMVRQPDFYAPGESMLVYGLRLVPREAREVPLQLDDVKITDVDEIPETNNAYWLAWELVQNGNGTKPADFDRLYKEVKSWGGRAIYMAFPSDVANANAMVTAARFRIAGRLMDYYEDGVDQIHYRYDLLS